MPRACTTCAHPDRDTIDAALDRGESLRTLATRYGVSRSGLARHAAAHRTNPPPAVLTVGIRPELAAWLDAQDEDPGAIVEAALERYRDGKRDTPAKATTPAKAKAPAKTKAKAPTKAKAKAPTKAPTLERPYAVKVPASQLPAATRALEVTGGQPDALDAREDGPVLLLAGSLWFPTDPAVWRAFVAAVDLDRTAAARKLAARVRDWARQRRIDLDDEDDDTPAKAKRDGKRDGTDLDEDTRARIRTTALELASLRPPPEDQAALKRGDVATVLRYVPDAEPSTVPGWAALLCAVGEMRRGLTLIEIRSPSPLGYTLAAAGISPEAAEKTLRNPTPAAAIRLAQTVRTRRLPLNWGDLAEAFQGTGDATVRRIVADCREEAARRRLTARLKA